MLRKIRIELFLIILISLGCKDSSRSNERYQFLLDFHKENIGANLYSELLDSIDNYFYLNSKFGFSAFRHDRNGFERKYHRSPIIGLNSKKNRLAGAILFEGENLFAVYNYYGYKLDNRWYFFIDNTQDV